MIGDRYLIRPCRVDEEAESLRLEQQVWNPFNWEADGSVGVGYDRSLHLVASDHDGTLVATIDACPMDWDGNPATLPAGGWTEVVQQASATFAHQPNYACALGASILPRARSAGLAPRMLTDLRDAALRAGYRGLVAPVRPSARWRMAELDIDAYAEQRLPDGRHFDPWVRTHESVGGRIIGSARASARFGGTREQWEGWAKMRLPENGRLLIDEAIGYLELAEGYGTLDEDSLWLLHEPRPLTASAADIVQGSSASPGPDQLQREAA